MNVASVPRNGNPATTAGNVPDFARSHKGERERKREHPKEQSRQNQTSLPAGMKAKLPKHAAQIPRRAAECIVSRTIQPTAEEEQ